MDCEYCKQLAPDWFVPEVRQEHAERKLLQPLALGGPLQAGSSKDPLPLADLADVTGAEPAQSNAIVPVANAPAPSGSHGIKRSASDVSLQDAGKRSCASAPFTCLSSWLEATGRSGIYKAGLSDKGEALLLCQVCPEPTNQSKKKRPGFKCKEDQYYPVLRHESHPCHIQALRDRDSSGGPACSKDPACSKATPVKRCGGLNLTQCTKNVFLALEVGPK